MIIVSYRRSRRCVVSTVSVCLRYSGSCNDHTPGGTESAVAGGCCIFIVLATAELFQSEACFPVAEAETSPAQRQSTLSDDSPWKEGLLQMPRQGSVLGNPVAGHRILRKYLRPVGLSSVTTLASI